jgi:hypothetical protein
LAQPTAEVEQHGITPYADRLWLPSRIKVAAFLGIVCAPDEKTARKAAIKQFKLNAEQTRALLIRRV